ncbi:MAG TPA: DUF4129 domain-containing protein [Pyrinomonadaceae bacterium]|nr:DUF4129 domain-containing protein [Pyrinomonadaceae bacterium]
MLSELLPYSNYVLRAILLFVFILVSPAFVHAASVAEYHRNVKEAITALDTLTQFDEEETESEYQGRFADTLTNVRKLMPESQMVECGEELCAVDNSWLHDQLKELQKATDTDWFHKLTQTIEQLKALDERITELESATFNGSTKSEAKQRLSGILARSEYATKSRAKSALARIIEAIGRWLQRLIGKQVPTGQSGASRVTSVVQAVVVLLAIGVLVYVIKLLLPRLTRRRKKERKVKPEPRIVLGERLEPDASAVDLLAEAETLARSGQIRAAIRKAYIALLVELGERKVISLAHHKTNRDYLRSVRSVPGLYPVMSGLTDTFERHWYGLGQPEANDWQNFRDAYKAAMHTKT